MTKTEIIKKYCILIVGIFVLCFGIALTTKAGLGTSPISSIPYTLSLIFSGITMGKFTAAINVLMLAGQYVILRNKTAEDMGRPGNGKALPWYEICIQFCLAMCMGIGIDASMKLLGGLAPGMYVAKLICAVCGCAVMGLGIYIQLVANVAMTPGDAFPRALTVATGRPYSQVRVATDTIMVVIAGSLCIIFLHNLAGVREATIICALLTGNMVNVYKNAFGLVK